MRKRKKISRKYTAEYEKAERRAWGRQRNVPWLGGIQRHLSVKLWIMHSGYSCVRLPTENYMTLKQSFQLKCLVLSENTSAGGSQQPISRTAETTKSTSMLHDQHHCLCMGFPSCVKETLRKGLPNCNSNKKLTKQTNKKIIYMC